MLTSKQTSVLSSSALFSAALIWGSSFFVMKNTVEMFPPNILLGIRFSIGCLLLSLVFHKRLKTLFRGGYLLRGAILGALLFAAYGFQTMGIVHTTAGKNAFLTTVYCILVPFLHWLIDRKRPDGSNMSAAALCLVGVGLVSLDGNLAMNIGDALTLVGGIFYALHIIAVARFTQDGDPILFTIVQFGTAAILAGAIGLATETFPGTISTSGILSLAYLAVFPTTLALLFQNLGQKHTPPAAASIILSLEAVFGVLFSVLLDGEVLTLRLALGFAIIFISVLISETKLAFLRPKPVAEATG
jgi:drug/metabolite transporter (DMT)-like permease